jgi:hypothetical protein
LRYYLQAAGSTYSNDQMDIRSAPERPLSQQTPNDGPWPIADKSALDPALKYTLPESGR